jgi:exonuclease SbcC
MRILTLEVKNFKPFSNLRLPNGDGELPSGLILIRGANSTGKSSLFEAILWALWGSDAVGLNNDELISFTAVHCQVILTFEVAGNKYKIDRSYDNASRMAVILYQWQKDAWKRIADKTKTVGTMLTDILNLQLKQALNTLLVRQGEVALIANATPSVLRNLIVKVYNIELLDGMTSHLEGLEKDLDIRSNALREDYTRPEQIEKQKADSQSRIDNLSDRLKTITKDTKKRQKELDALPSIDTIEAISDAQDEIEQSTRDYSQMTERRDSELEPAGLVGFDEKLVAARLELFQKQEEDLKERLTQDEEQATGLVQQIGAIQGEESDLQEKISDLEDISIDSDAVECPTCTKPLTEGERQSILKDYKSRLVQGSKRIKEIKKEQKQLKEAINTTKERLQEVTNGLDAIHRITDLQSEVESSEEALRAAETQLSDILREYKVKDVSTLLKKHKATSLRELQRRVTEIETELRSVQSDQETLNDDIQQEKDKIGDLENQIVEMQELKAEIDDYDSMQEHARHVRLKLIRGFIAEYVVQKRLIGIIRAATNKYVREFTNNQYTSIDLTSTPSRGKTGPGLQLKIRDQRDNASKKTSQLSFGDRTAISLGLRLGISRTMSAIRPLKDSPTISPRVRTVMLDEPLGGLDKSRRTSVVRNLINDTSFEQILLITHTDVQGWEGVPVIDVTKSGATSIATLVLPGKN